MLFYKNKNIIWKSNFYLFPWLTSGIEYHVSRSKTGKIWRYFSKVLVNGSYWKDKGRTSAAVGILGLLTNDNRLQLSQLSRVWPHAFHSFLSQLPACTSGDMLGCPAQKWTILLSRILHSSFQNPNFHDVTKRSLLLWRWPASCRMSCCTDRSLIASLISISS